MNGGVFVFLMFTQLELGAKPSSQGVNESVKRRVTPSSP